MAFVEFFILAVICCYLLYKWSVAKYNVLSERGVPHDKPWPLLGNTTLKEIFGKSSFFHSIIERYEAFKSHKVYGTYVMRDVTIFIRDLELLKKVGIKDFDHFPNHRSSLGIAGEEIISKSLIVIKDDKWRQMRSTLSPAFTGNKMRLMFELVNECCIEGIHFLDNELESSKRNTLELEMKDYYTRFTNDAIASTAFGIKVDSFKDRNNEFFTIGSNMTQFKGWAQIKLVLFTIVPKLMKALRVKIFDEKTANYFYRLVFDAMKYRQQHNIIRPDMIHLLMEAKLHHEDTKTQIKGDHEDLTDDDLLAQCLLFFFAGFDTVSTCLCFTAHELLENPEVQERLFKEILEMEKELGGKPLKYDDVMKMKYLDMVISESLRKWPPAFLTDRVCNSDYKLTDEDGNIVVEFKKDDSIFIPIIAIHRDPEYYPNPEKFDPERFSEENKKEIKSLSYIPFGIGPRNCIGNRLALMEVKTLLYHMLLKYKIEASAKTCKDLMASIQGFQLIPKEKFWMKFVPRNKVLSQQ